MPLLSIITITYNAEEFLERTILSILKQSNQAFEYLIIDGKSTDSTLSIVENYRSRVDALVSEPDKGLYDAMNRGLKQATGKYIWYLNAGDEIADANTIDRLFTILKNNPDIVYSDTYMVDEKGKVLGLRSEILPHKVPEKLTWQKFNLGMLICHQSFIVKRALAPNYIENNLSADIDWEIKCLKLAKRVEQFSGVLSRYLVGGLSSQKHLQSLKDRYRVLKYHFGFIPNAISHVRIVLRGLLRKLN
jgi:glycosyltransferase involved in cell wall biosynthesis